MTFSKRKRIQALNFRDRYEPGADHFTGGGPLLPHSGEGKLTSDSEFLQAAELTYRIESRDGPPGQSNLRLVAEIGRTNVGRIDYTVYRGTPAIQMVHVNGPLQRRGFGKAMALRLQTEYPGIEISWGMLTGDGAKLYASIPKMFIKDAEYEAKHAEFLAVEEKLAHYEKMGKQFDALDNPTADQRAEFVAVFDDWNDQHDLKYALEQYLASTPPGKTILCAEEGPTPVKVSNISVESSFDESLGLALPSDNIYAA